MGTQAQALKVPRSEKRVSFMLQLMSLGLSMGVLAIHLSSKGLGQKGRVLTIGGHHFPLLLHHERMLFLLAETFVAASLLEASLVGQSLRASNAVGVLADRSPGGAGRDRQQGHEAG